MLKMYDRSKFTTMVSLHRIERVKNAIRKTPSTRLELEESTFSSKSRLIQILRYLMSDDGKEREVRIAKWRRTTEGGYLPVYALGSKPDSPKIKPRTEKQRYAARVATEAKRDQHRAMLRAIARKARIKKYPGSYKKIVAYVTEGHCTTGDVANLLGMTSREAFCFISELCEQKKLMPVSKLGAKPTVWGLYAEGWKSEEENIKQSRVVAWQPQKVAPQSIFSALGL